MSVLDSICSIGHNTFSYSASAFEFLEMFFTSKSNPHTSDNELARTYHGQNENEVIIINSPHAVFLIDPYEQGALWIKSNEAVTVHTLSSERDHSLKNVVEESVTTGKPLLLRDMDYTIHPDILALIKTLYSVEGMASKAFLFGKEIDVSPFFRLYVGSRANNPILITEDAARLTVVDCSITVPALENQLLSSLMETEKPDLHRNRNVLLQEVTSSKARIVELNQVLLKSLSQTEGYLLEDQAVINALINIKSAVQDADDNLQKAKDAETRINETYEAFRPVATISRLLFGVLEEMRFFSRLYQFTLQTFMGLFARAVEMSEKTPSTSSRIQSIIYNLKTIVIRNFLKQYFDDHIPVFLLLTSFRILCHQDKSLTQDHLTFIIRGGHSVTGREYQSTIQKPKEWIPDSVWLSCAYLSENFYEFGTLIESLSKRESWKIWWEKEAPELEPLPDFNHMDSFHKLMMYRALREDRLMTALQVFVTDILGESCYQQRNVLSDLDELCNFGNCSTPLLCIFKSGFDPTTLIVNLAKKKHVTVDTVTLTKSHKSTIATLVSKGTLNGSWVVLQNAHLALDLLGDIEFEILKQDVSAEFRIWLTTEPVEAFPIGFLRLSLKAVVQPPSGIRNSMYMLASESISDEILGSSDSQKWYKTFYTVCYTFCIIRERHKFGGIGFSVPYEFDIIDWSTSVAYMRDNVVDHEGKEDEVSSALLFIIGEIVFGGKVKNDWDRRVIDACIEVFLSYDHEKQSDFLPVLQLPESNSINSFVDLVLRMPSVDSADRFGLSLGAEIAMKTDQARQFLEILAALPALQSDVVPLPSPGPPVQKKEDYLLTTINELLCKLDSIRNLLKGNTAPEQTKPEKQVGRSRRLSVETMPNNANRAKVQISIGSQQSVVSQPLLSFLHQEATLIQNVILSVQGSLKELLSCLSTHSKILSETQTQALSCLYDSAVPITWNIHSWPAPSLASWFNILLQRHDQLDKWITSGKLKSYWLGGFCHPLGFVFSLKMEVSKKRGWSLEQVRLVTEISAKENESYSHDGVIIHGNFIEGANWSYREGRLADNTKKDLVTDFPKILLYFNAPAPAAQDSSLPNVQYKLQPWESRKEGYYFCPVYASKKRSSSTFLWAMPLRTEEASMKWILRGVAVMCSKD